jgi:polyferredoxin
MAATCLSVASDFIFIALIRRLLRWASGLASFRKIAGVVFINCCIAFLLVLLPFSLGTQVYNWLTGQAVHEGSRIIAQKGLYFLSATLVATAMGNFITVLVAILFIVLAFIMLLHRVFWPFLARPIYALQRLGIARRNKLMITLGLALLGFAIGGIPAWLKDVIAIFN